MNNPNTSRSTPHIQYLGPSTIEYKLRVKIYQSLIKLQPQEQKRKFLQRTLQKFKQKGDKNIFPQFGQDIQKKCYLMRNQFEFYKEAFDTVAKQEKYQQFRGNNINDALIKIQEKIKINDFKGSYIRALLVLKKQFSWSTQFVNQITGKVQNWKKLEQQKTSNKSKQIPIQPKLLPKGQSQQSIQFPQPLKLEDKPRSSKSLQKGLQKGQSIEKPSKKKVKLEQTGNEQVSQKKIAGSKKQKQRQKQKQEDESVSLSQQLKNQQKKQKAAKEIIIQEIHDKPRQTKSRVVALKQYLQKRKEFANMNQNKLKQISQFLNHNLQKFMKFHLTKLLDYAKLNHVKVKNNPAYGNEFTYFSREGFNLEWPKKVPHQAKQDLSKVLKVNYRSKMQLYSTLRVKEDAIQNQMMKRYANRKQDDKKSDKKLWEYLLRPSPHDKAQICLPEQTSSDRLEISQAHVRYLFQNHAYIRKSYLMFSSYI